MNVSSIETGATQSALATIAGRLSNLPTAAATTTASNVVPATISAQPVLVVAEIVQALFVNQTQVALSGNQSQVAGQLAPSGNQIQGAGQLAPSGNQSQVASQQAPSSNQFQAAADKGSGPGAYLIRVGGTLIEASTAESFSIGSKVLARLESTAQGTVLTVDPPDQVSPGEIASAILRDMSPRQPFGDVLQQLNQAIPRLLASATGDPVATTNLEVLQSSLERILGPTQSSPEPEHLAQFVQDGGLHYEAKLGRLSGNEAVPQQVKQMAAGDLKGQLLNVLATMKGISAGDSETHPIELVRQAVSEIETQQALNLVAKSEGEPYQIQVPLATQGTNSTLQLSIDPDTSGQSSSHSQSNDFNLMMHLDFTELGDTWVDARIAGQNVRAVLYVESEPGRQAARADLSTLNQSLQELGFGNIMLDVRSTSEMPTGSAAARFNALDAGMPASISLIDRKA